MKKINKYSMENNVIALDVDSQEEAKQNAGPLYNAIEMNEIKTNIDPLPPFPYTSPFDNLLILFVNPISGNQEGKIFLSIASK